MAAQDSVRSGRQNPFHVLAAGEGGAGVSGAPGTCPVPSVSPSRLVSCCHSGTQGVMAWVGSLVCSGCHHC